jgi:His-Xaa-Ser system protein HxsD
MSAEPLPNGMQIRADQREVQFTVSEELYPLEVIQGAAYLFLDRCYVWMDRPPLPEGERQVRLRLRTKQGREAGAGELEAMLEGMAGEFSNELLNQALRRSIGQSNARIREFIMARAFFAADGPSTVDRLLAELDAEEMASDPLEIQIPWSQGAEKKDA